MNYAPIAVFAYDRPHHLKACIESLAKNKEAEYSSLFVSSDGARDAKSIEKVRAVRDYIKNIRGFKKIFSFCPKENTSGEILFRTYESIKSASSRYILTEDDNVFSPYALKYFNQGLDFFEDDPRIHAICGYIYPGFPSKTYEQVYLQCTPGWGIALWRHKDIYPYINERALAAEVLTNRALFEKVSNSIPDLIVASIDIREGKLQAGDASRTSYILKNNQVCVLPSVSLVRNMGNDGSGVHCGVNDIYKMQKISDQEIHFNMSKPVEPAPDDIRWISRFFGGRGAIIRNELIFYDLNTHNFVGKFLIRFVFSLRPLLRLIRKTYSFTRVRFL